MIQLLIFALISALLGMLLVTRLTEKPLRKGFQLTQDAANTFQTTPLNLPAVPSISIVRGDAKALGIEVMGYEMNLQFPDTEAGQNNAVTCEIAKGPAPTAMLGLQDNRVILREELVTDIEEVTAVGEVAVYGNQRISRDMTDHDGNGEIVADDEIHLSLLGTGNANPKSTSGYLLYHLVEIDTEEALFEMIETAV